MYIITSIKSIIFLLLLIALHINIYRFLLDSNFLLINFLSSINYVEAVFIEHQKYATINKQNKCNYNQKELPLSTKLLFSGESRRLSLFFCAKNAATINTTSNRMIMVVKIIATLKK